MDIGAIYMDIGWYRYRRYFFGTGTVGTFLVPVPLVLLWYRYRQKIAKYRGIVPVL